MKNKNKGRITAFCAIAFFGVKNLIYKNKLNLLALDLYQKEYD